MKVSICKSKQDLGKEAATKGAGYIRDAIANYGQANIIVATGASQFEMLSELVKEDIDWSKVSGFHLDEYIDLPEDHPASFRKYLKQRFVDIVQPKNFYYVDGNNDPIAECQRLGKLIQQVSIDVAFVGIGENAHLAFNDPPADFEVQTPFLVVELDEACRTQQMNEGWFETLDDVPKSAISMSIAQIMKSQNIICSVPDLRKADAVSKSVMGPVTPEVPASIMQQHLSTFLFLDPDSAAKISQS